MLHRYHIFQVPDGFCGIAWSPRGTTRFQLPSGHAETAARNLMRRLSRADAAPPPESILKVVDAAQRYFRGEMIDFSDVELDLGPKPEFFRQCYAAARRVRWGQTTTYGALAKQLGGGSEMARDVGQAMAGNPIPLIIPCHRVLAAGGKLGGFSAPGGVQAKLRMLALEGFRAPTPPPEQQSIAF